jgi:transcription elongation factor GreA
MSTANDIPSDAAWLTQDAYYRLKAELEDLSGRGRSEIAKRIEAARAEGDLSENGGYHAAKEEQGKLEARIRQLHDLLHRAHVGEAPAADGRVTQGMLVTVRFAGDDDLEQFLLADRALKGDLTVDVYSPGSPLGSAVLGAEVGDSVSYQAPNGRTFDVEIVAAEPFSG